MNRRRSAGFGAAPGQLYDDDSEPDSEAEACKFAAQSGSGPGLSQQASVTGLGRRLRLRLLTKLRKLRPRLWAAGVGGPASRIRT